MARLDRADLLTRAAARAHEVWVRLHDPLGPSDQASAWVFVPRQEQGRWREAVDAALDRFIDDPGTALFCKYIPEDIAAQSWLEFFGHDGGLYGDRAHEWRSLPWLDRAAWCQAINHGCGIMFPHYVECPQVMAYYETPYCYPKPKGMR